MDGDELVLASLTGIGRALALKSTIELGKELYQLGWPNLNPMPDADFAPHFCRR